MKKRHAYVTKHFSIYWLRFGTFHKEGGFLRSGWDSTGRPALRGIL
jgi:hypothetical protein